MTPAELPPSPFATRGLAAFAGDLRQGRVTVGQAVGAVLGRLDGLEPKLQACTFVDRDRARRHAAALDALLASGVDLGPLMGVPVLLKDLFTVGGMPTTAGSRVPVSDLVPPQGTFVTRLLRAGCVPLGKTRTTEFALGGFNLLHGVPWNPCDLREPRMTGGSSHGSAVAMAAGLCGFSVGGDTGGSVRWPAALCGVFGYKASTTRWPGDGIFPLAPRFDSIGLFTADAGDAAFVEAAIDGRQPDPVPEPGSLVLAVPRAHFLDNLDVGVARCFEAALQRLQAAGVSLVERELPQAGEIDAVFRLIVPADLLAFLGRDRVRRHLHAMDPVAAERALVAEDLDPEEERRIRERCRQIVAEVQSLLVGTDAWLSPTVPVQPAPVGGFRSVADVAAWNRLATQNTRPGNLFDQCGVSLPVQHLGAPLPVGLQLCSGRGQDARLLAVARAVESVLGRPPASELQG